MRKVWWDYSNKDKALHLANTSTGKTNYAGERGFVHTVKYKTSLGACADKTWP
jgi:hypothetical protein